MWTVSEGSKAEADTDQAGPIQFKEVPNRRRGPTKQVIVFGALFGKSGVKFVPDPIKIADLSHYGVPFLLPVDPTPSFTCPSQNLFSSRPRLRGTSRAEACGPASLRG
ncbi:hypothetical protein CRG98_017410 [Punica granatum]|uniref:Uncharacterized protein n=1 Tax=Punica granatum TaxID=22663 RepID=A0A2I0K0F9_PUNGR|nr:hypothetical protein CRG98_017410 [Punica granatum]